MRLDLGHPPSPGPFATATFLFVKGIALVYFIAFASFGVQAAGLIGSRGVLPAGAYLDAITGACGASAFSTAPGILWLNHSDAMLRGVAAAGALLAVAALLGGPANRLTLALLWVLYLSVVSAGQTFFSFQWDYLLLEAGFLAIFLTGRRLDTLLLWWLLFRLLFSSGAVKLLSGDPAWRSLTALQYHYQTQPLPTPIAWYLHQAPPWFQTLSALFVFAAELAAPLLIFGGRRLRIVAASVIAALQLLIALTGNYTFFNLLTAILCIPLLDNETLRRLPQRLHAAAQRTFHPRWPRAGAWTRVALAAVIVPLSLLQMAQTLTLPLPAPARAFLDRLSPFGIVNSYGLFANITTTRPEIIIEGSNDGITWREYEFPDKPGRLTRRPGWVAPDQPRLDWQMWFAALGSYHENPFFVNLVQRLLEASPPVLSLLASSPFHGAPPRYVRALLYDYRFTNAAERRATGAWWKRRLLGAYFPAVSLRPELRFRTPANTAPARPAGAPAPEPRGSPSTDPAASPGPATPGPLVPRQRSTPPGAAR
jgi:hypothetical protein